MTDVQVTIEEVSDVSLEVSGSSESSVVSVPAESAASVDLAEAAEAVVVEANCDEGPIVVQVSEISGPPGPPGPAGDFGKGWLGGIQNDSNRVFTAPENFVPGSEFVSCNGIPQRTPAHYSVTGSNQITFTFAPPPWWALIIEYRRA